MKYGSDIFKIIEYGLLHEDAKLRARADLLAGKLDEDGDHNSAKHIRIITALDYQWGEQQDV